ncbi:MAG TPA: glycosyltransferase [Terriglobia bacterium]|nr:glycosyltransferase [Terriglobia bacterium]
MKISIVIPAFNEEKLLGATLASVERAAESFRRRGWSVETIVCDNNSTDRTAEIALDHGASVVFEPVNQIGRARNRGASAASGDWLVFVDADSHPSAELFDDVAAAVLSGRHIAGGSTVQMDTRAPGALLMIALWNLTSRVNRWFAGSFIFCDAAAFRAVGGFSHEHFVSEEIDLSRRLKELAKTEGRRLTILHRSPLLTSARKLRLYSRGEHVRFLLRLAWGRGRAIRERENCAIWYDGRR